MQIGNTPLLITATFDTGKTPQVALSDVGSRVEKHMEGLIAWLRDPVFKRIVFVKNCTTSIKGEILEQVAAVHGKELEFLEVSSSSRTELQGKGYGEGDLISQALEQSLFLKDAEDFYKVTGKLYSPDLYRLFSGGGEAEFIQASYQTEGAFRLFGSLTEPFYRHKAGGATLGFLRRKIHLPWGLIAASPKGWIDTRIYRVQIEFYRKRLHSSHKRVQDGLGYPLEAAFYDDLTRSKNNIRVISEAPIIFGTSGTLGTTAGKYTLDIQKEARELASQLFTG